MTDHLILLHGLWMRGIALGALRYRLDGEGFEIESFDYMSIGEDPQRAVERLRERMRTLEGTVHLVGHSLGGLLALDACRGRTDLPHGRIVCMGSPLRGSAGARGLAKLGASWLLGHSRDVLESGLAAWEDPREVGVIAGNTPVGLGALSQDLGDAHDGTVAVAETRLPGISGHCVVESSHTGLLFSADVAEQVAVFLRHGRFRHSDDAAGGARPTNATP